MKAEPLQLPLDFARMSQQPMSATKQAFIEMASAPLLNLEELDQSFNFNDSEPEILLSDSDEEEEELIAMEHEDLDIDAETAIDSADLENISNNSLDEEGIDHMDDFDERTDRNSVMSSSNSMNSNTINMGASSDSQPRRVFIDLPAVDMSASADSFRQ